MKQSIIQNEQGYTLVETTVALVLFATGALGLVGALGAFALDRSSADISEAFSVAQQHLTVVVRESEFTNAEIKLTERMTVRRDVSLDKGLALVTVEAVRSSGRIPVRVILTRIVKTHDR